MQHDLSYFVSLCVQNHKWKAKYFWEDRTALKLIPAALDQADSAAQDKRKHIQINICIQDILAQDIRQFMVTYAYYLVMHVCYVIQTP